MMLSYLEVVTSKLHSKMDFHMPEIVKKELLRVQKKVTKNDRDFFFLIDGEEGVGKSVLGQQVAKTLDPEFNIDKIVFTADQFIQKIKDPNTKKGDCILLDEAFSAANSRSALSEVNKSLIAVATEMRQKNLFIIIILPSFFDLDKYFAIWRSRVLIHVYFHTAENGDEKRHYIIFPKDHKKTLYLTGKKEYNYSFPKSPFPAFRFPPVYTVDEEAYRKKKAEAFRDRKVSAQSKNWLLQRNAYIQYLLENTSLTQEEIGQIPKKWDYRAVSRDIVARIKLNHKKDLNMEENGANP